MMKRSERTLRLVAAMLSLVMVVAVSVAPIGSSADKLTDSISTQEAKLNSLTEKAKEYKELLNKAQQAENNLAAELSNYQDLVSTYQGIVSTANDLIDEYDSSIADKNAEISENEAKYQKKYEYFLQRLRATYERGKVTYLQLIFSAGSFLQMLESLDRSGDLLSYDSRIMRELEEETEKLQKEKAELEELRRKEKETREIYSQRVGELEETITQMEAKLETIKAEIEKNKDAVSYYDKAAEAAEASLDALYQQYYAQKAADEAAKKKAEEEAAKNNTSVSYEGPTYVTDSSKPCWPLPSSYGKDHISSPYGYRYHPISKKWKMHTGTDIYAPAGTAIYAVLGGRVIYAGYGSSYGYHVIIDHGNGVSTLYAHCSKLLVSSGQTITKGQQVGKVGMTGSATGNHLHIEWRTANGTENPMNHL